MKKFLILMFLAALTLSCIKRNRVEASVTRDCTGTYIRIQEKDFLVCNINKLSKFNEGDKVQVAYKLESNCPEMEGRMVCMLFHANEGMVRILKVKKLN